MMAKRGRQYEVHMSQASRETLNRPFGQIASNRSAIAVDGAAEFEP